MANRFKKWFLTPFIALTINCYIWLLFKLCRIDINLSSDAKILLEKREQCILAFWHSRILLFPKFIAKYNKFYAVVSTHNDAEYLALILRFQGHNLIRGSSRKGSLNAMREIIRQVNKGYSIAITPDGPKGPRFKIKGSIIQISKKYMLPIVPATFSATHSIVFKSWDRFIIPIPFISKIKIDIANPMHFKDLDDDKVLEFVMLKQVKDADNLSNLKIDYQ